MDKRNFVQIIATFLTNINISGFVAGSISQYKLKYACVPGLNCYSCPGAVGSCPIGSLQAVIGSFKYKFSFFIVGIISFFGIVLGRVVCGWLCPFGLIQDLLYKIKARKLKINEKVDRDLRYLKYLILLVFVILMPMLLVNEFGMSPPYFCKWICPAGTLEGGIPLIIKNKSLRESIGFLFSWKVFLLVFTIISSILIYRPFCKYICPLGAFYGFFNKVSFYQYDIDKNKCTSCKACARKCNMGVEIYKYPTSAECIRCGECVKVCSKNAIKKGFKIK